MPATPPLSERARQSPTSSWCQLPDVGTELDYSGMLNCVLPADIRIIGWSPVDDDFHARCTLVCPLHRVQAAHSLHCARTQV